MHGHGSTTRTQSRDSPGRACHRRPNRLCHSTGQDALVYIDTTGDSDSSASLDDVPSDGDKFSAATVANDANDVISLDGDLWYTDTTDG